jgi:hypothetical protein
MRVHASFLSIALLPAVLGLSIACSKAKPSDDTITKDVQTKVAADPDTTAPRSRWPPRRARLHLNHSPAAPFSAASYSVSS